jgi:hypothetical protein
MRSSGTMSRNLAIAVASMPPGVYLPHPRAARTREHGSGGGRRAERETPGGINRGASAPAERVGVEPTVPLRVHLISNQAPSATRSSLRGGPCQRVPGLSIALHTGSAEKSRRLLARERWEPPRASREGPCYSAGVAEDPSASERFIRIVGRRERAPVGQPPPAASRQAMTRMAGYRTRAPKGVFIYRSHEQANADRQRWRIDAMLAVRVDG